MKRKLSIVSLLIAISTSASASIVSVNVCGVHSVTATGKHYIIITSGDLIPGSYELFATHQSGTYALNSMKNGQEYCIEGSFITERPKEGIAIKFVR